VTFVALLGTSGVAAASGSLPGPLQRRTHDFLSAIGISVPDGRTAPDDQNRGDGDHDSGPSTSAHTSSTAPGGPSVPGKAEPDGSVTGQEPTRRSGHSGAAGSQPAVAPGGSSGRNPGGAA